MGKNVEELTIIVCKRVKKVKTLGKYNKEVFKSHKYRVGMSFPDIDVYMKFGKTPLVQPGQWYEFGGVRQVDVGKTRETSLKNMAREM